MTGVGFSEGAEGPRVTLTGLGDWTTARTFDAHNQLMPALLDAPLPVFPVPEIVGSPVIVGRHP